MTPGHHLVPRFTRCGTLKLCSLRCPVLGGGGALATRSLPGGAPWGPASPLALVSRGVAQLGRAPGLEPGSRWFKSIHPGHWDLAQLVEHRNLTPRVGGSSPPVPTIRRGRHLSTGQETGLSLQ